MELAKNLTRLSQERGMPIATLARLSGVKQPTLFGWTTGRAVHNLDDLRKVCGVLKVGLHEILFGVPDPCGGEGFIEELQWGNLKIRLYRTTR
ncbi:MAG: helix-turn-helix domain-containing protein [Bacteriovoracaceae bacterium]